MRRYENSNSQTRLLKPAKELSMQHLAKISALLDSEQSRTTNINKQIQNEVSLARKNDGNIVKNINRISHEGQLLANRYEQERDKCVKLEALVKNVEEELYREKTEQAQDMRNKVETDKLAEHISILNDKEKALEKVLEKSNAASYDLSKKEDTIRALRSERTIVSALFDKIERQLCSLQHCYKVLVIQRKRQEDLLQHSIEQFNETHTTGHRHISKLANKNDEARGRQLGESKLRRTQDNKYWQQEEAKVMAKVNTELGQERRASIVRPVVEDNGNSNVSNHLSVGKEPGITHQHSSSDLFREKERQRDRTLKLEQDIAKVRHEKCVKKIFNELGISHIKELPTDMTCLEQRNEELLKTAEQLYQQISKAEEDIHQLGKEPCKRAGPSLRKARLSKKQSTLQNKMEQINRHKRQLQEFRSICRVVLERARQTQLELEPLPSQFLNEEQEIIFYMGQLEKFFENSYKEPVEIDRRPAEQGQPKALSFLLNSTRDHQHISIYQEQDLLQFARKNLEKIQKP